MKKVILLVLLMPVMAFGQVVENFESGSINNWVQSPDGRWKADTTESLSGEFSLHHIFDNPDAGTDIIGMQINTLHLSEGSTSWSFLVKHGYDPSSSNNWSVFLMSDAGPADMLTENGVNGFAIGVNLTGYDDTLRLLKVKGNQIITVISSHINWQTVIGIAIAVKIIVERTWDGTWTLVVQQQNGDIISSGYGFDNELFNTAWFDLCYTYSSTRDRLLWFDDLNIEGIFYKDNEPPVVTGCEVSGTKTIDITLNEEALTDMLTPGNFSLDTKENVPLSVTLRKGLTYRLEFANIFINRNLNYLTIDSLCDKSGNCVVNVRVPFTAVWAEPGDVIISEIMADPLPEVSLPAKEYLELTNRTDYPFNLKNWKLSADDQNVVFPETTIQPSGILIICSSKDTSQFSKFGKVEGLKQFPSLTIGGRIICLSDSSGILIHGVEYSPDWYGDELKSGGGWSLEMIDTRFPFYYDGNWTASTSRKGGTPGTINSTARSNPDLSFQGVQNVFPDDSINVTIRFSEPVFDLSGIKKYLTVEGNSITDLIPADPLFRKFSFKTKTALLKKKDYQLDISGEIKDFAGNIIEKNKFVFGLPEAAEHSDILFNELLFNPLPGDPDYLELYNNSDKVVDASRLQLVSVNDDSGDTSQVYLISDEKRCIMPGSYYAITTDRERVCGRYFSADREHLFESGNLPSMSDNKGHLILLNRELDKIDEVIYNEAMHYSLLSSYEGVALEKTAPSNVSGEACNWHSASESSGWGTPGAPNSVFIELPATSDKIEFSSSKITPDNDGNEDILAIRLKLKGNGNVVSVTIFDEEGNYVRKLAANMLAGPEATLIWDGTADDRSPVGTGIYIVFINLYDDTGKSAKWKKVCTVIR